MQLINLLVDSKQFFLFAEVPVANKPEMPGMRTPPEKQG
jgi:hypothetical protein